MEDYFNEKVKTHENDFVQIMDITEFYDEVEQQMKNCNNPVDVLVLGCGTGLEIERIKFPANVTAIDISPEMIKELNHKGLSHLTLNTICASILDYDFGDEAYDLVISCYTLHHFNKLQKMDLYQRIYTCLRDGGNFINGDSMAKDLADAGMRLQEAEEIYAQESLPFGSLHIDVPMTYDQEVRLLNRAGFTRISLEREWTRAKLYKATK